MTTRIETEDVVAEDDAPCPPHCCCCDHYEPCCDCGEIMPSKACIGERCWCGAPASKKVGEEILFDDPQPERHNLTAYVCASHYAQLMGPIGGKQVGVELSRAALSAAPIERLREENARVKGHARELEIQRLSTLGAMYNFAPQAVARMCGQFDSSGTLLDEVRKLVSRAALTPSADDDK